MDDNYQYNYVPLLLTVLENEIGEKKMWDWLAYILKDKNPRTDYNYFKSSLFGVGVKESVFKSFESQYINDTKAQENVINRNE